MAQPNKVQPDQVRCWPEPDPSPVSSLASQSPSLSCSPLNTSPRSTAVRRRHYSSRRRHSPPKLRPTLLYWFLPCAFLFSTARAPWANSSPPRVRSPAPFRTTETLGRPTSTPCLDVPFSSSTSSPTSTWPARPPLSRGGLGCCRSDLAGSGLLHCGAVLDCGCSALPRLRLQLCYNYATKVYSIPPQFSISCTVISWWWTWVWFRSGHGQWCS
jgi:hypothetical protein